MGKETAIEYPDSTVNPMVGCNGCELYNDNPILNHCYASTLCNRYVGLKGWPPISFTQPTHFRDRLPKAIKWSDLTGKDRKDKSWLNGLPRIIFVNDISDGFCYDADPYTWLAPRLDEMAVSPHIWLLLTKWPAAMGHFWQTIGEVPKNFWLGTSFTSRPVGWRMVELCRILGANLWLSAEPLLGPLSFQVPCSLPQFGKQPGIYDVLRGEWWPVGNKTEKETGLQKIRWVALGGESGNNARPMHPHWARVAREDCEAAGTDFFFKQWGEWLPVDQDTRKVHPDTREHVFKDGTISMRVGKHFAGSMLDGVAYKNVPFSRTMTTQPVAAQLNLSV